MASKIEANTRCGKKVIEADFLLTMNFTIFTKQCILFKIVPLGGYTAKEALFPLFVAVLKSFCWNTLQLVGYALLDIIPRTKITPFMKQSPS
jgi:hypothetical protein